MPRLRYSPSQKRRASTQLSLALSEADAAAKLVAAGSYRESVVHLYFAAFHASQSLIIDRLTGNSHKQVEAQLHKSYKERRLPPQRYVKLHSALHELRNRTNYRDTEIPNPSLLRMRLAALQRYVTYARRTVPTTELLDILRDMREKHADISELSFEVYVPSDYGYGAEPMRLTLWAPSEAIRFTPSQLATRAQALLHSLGSDASADYVVGLNSRVAQHQDVHLLLLDLDTTDPALESALKPIGGYLFRSGRGFHFIGRDLVKGRAAWERRLIRLRSARALRDHVDRDFIDLSVSRGYSTLRVTASGEKPLVPLFYKEL